MLEHLGSGWSMWPAANREGGLNIVTGNDLITSQIMTVLLLQPGECPHEPDMGISPEIFEPMTNVQPKIWQYEAGLQIKRFVPGIRTFNIYIPQQLGTFSELSARVDFVADTEVTTQILTFGWYEYIGVRNNADPEVFRRTVALNGRFFSL